MRPIDADELAFVSCLKCAKEDCDRKCAWLSIIDDATTIDTVEVVRCKDCKHWVNARSLLAITGCTENVGHCKWANRMVRENGYCVYGKRKNNNEEEE